MNSPLKPINSPHAPEAIGPYSQAIQAGGFIFCSGQLPVEPDTGNIAEGIRPQTQQVLRNLAAVLETAGLHRSSIVKTTVFLSDMNHFAEMNEVYGDFFGDHKPARATLEVARLPKDVLVEIECVAVVPD